MSEFSAAAVTRPAAATLSTTKNGIDVDAMLKACSDGDVTTVRRLIAQDKKYAALQDEKTGRAPLMQAAEAGHIEICQLLLKEGAPWNAIDRSGRCAGNFATDNGHWPVVDLLVDAGTKAELILGASIRAMKHAASHSREHDGVGQFDSTESTSGVGESGGPVEEEPSTKPDYLRRHVRYDASNTKLLDEDGDAVMMEWERPLMKAHAQVLTGASEGKRVLNVGFGLGIIDAELQNFSPSMHIIIEAHPDVHAKMLREGWDKKRNVRICFGRWQDVMPRLISEGVQVDGIFYDTYAESFMDLEDFQGAMAKILAKPGGIYSFFNGLAPDNLFFHGVACQCVKLQLSRLGLDTEFAQCEISVKEEEWHGVRRKYWHGRETYYLPIATWNAEYLNEDSGGQRSTKGSYTSSDKSDDEPDAKRKKTIIE